MNEDLSIEFERFMEGYRLGWDEQTCVDRFQAFVAKAFNECSLEDVSRFEAVLIEQAVNVNVRRHILERVERVLWASRWRRTSFDCPFCEGNGLIEEALVQETGEHIFVCDECDSCWDAIDAMSVNWAEPTRVLRFGDLKWWQLAPEPER